MHRQAAGGPADASWMPCTGGFAHARGPCRCAFAHPIRLIHHVRMTRMLAHDKSCPDSAQALRDGVGDQSRSTAARSGRFRPWLKPTRSLSRASSHATTHTRPLSGSKTTRLCPGNAVPRCTRNGCRRFSLAGKFAVDHAQHPPRQTGSIIQQRGRRSLPLGLPRTSPRNTAGSLCLSLSYNAASDIDSLSVLRAATSSNGHRPARPASSTSQWLETSISAGADAGCAPRTPRPPRPGISRSSAARAITHAGACSANRSTTACQISALLIR